MAPADEGREAEAVLAARGEVACLGSETPTAFVEFKSFIETSVKADAAKSEIMAPTT
jgi:hypothetical protein